MNKKIDEKIDEKSENKLLENQAAFSQKIGSKAEYKQKARSNPKSEIWIGLGMMGIVGWSVVVPTLIGAALGYWIDKHYPGSHSWTLAMLILGLGLGCLNAWYWVSREEKKMHEDNDE